MQLIAEFAADLRLAVRTLGRHRAFAGMAIATLAVGLGANIAAFSAFDAVLVRNLPVEKPEQLVTFDWLRTSDSMIAGYSGYGRPGPVSGTGIRTSFSPITFHRFRQSSQTLSDVFAFAERYRLNVETSGQTGSASGQLVSGNYFNALGVPPLMGRVLTDLDDTASAPPVAVITHRYWQRRFSGDPDIIGRPVTVNRWPMVIVGVTPESFNGTLVSETSDLTLPLAKAPLIEADGVAKRASVWWVRVMGRVRPGRTLQQVHADLQPPFEDSVRESWERRPADTPGPRRTGMPVLRVLPGSQGPDGPRRDAMQELGVALAVVATVLLIGCANVANLLLVRGLERRQELAVRFALGAGRARLVRQLLTESLVLGAAGGALGIVLAFWAKDFLTWLPSSSTPIVHTTIGARVLLFSWALSTTTAMLFGIFPALRSVPVGLITRMPRNAWRGFAGRAFVVVQVAGCVVLLAAAGLALRTVRNLNAVDLGFDTHRLLLFRVDAGSGQRAENHRPSVYEEVAAAIDALPGVESSTFSAVPLLARTQWSETVQPDRGGTPKDAFFQAVRWTFFETHGIRLLSGRSLSRGDHARAAPVAVINELMARQVFGDPHPIGRHFQLLTGPRRNEPVEVVGIVKDTKYSSLEERAPPTFYLSWAQLPAMAMTFAVRTAVDPSGLAPLVRDVVKRAAPGVAVLNVKTQDQQIAETIARPRALAIATSVFSAVGLLLACLGIYGVVSHDVTQRTREMGIRIALGARQGDLFRLVLPEVLVVAVAGAVMGVVLAMNAVKLIASLLFEVSPGDPLTLAGAVVVLMTAATGAAIRPVQRAARLNVTDALRHD